MTTILAGANWTMWPGLNPDSLNFGTYSGSSNVRSHARQAYALRTDVSFVREHDAISEGWFALVCRTPDSIGSAIEDYFLAFLDENDDVLCGFWRDDTNSDGDVCINAPFLSEPIVALQFNSSLAEISVSFKLDTTEGYLRVFMDKELVGSFEGDTVENRVPAIKKTRYSRVASGTGFGTRDIIKSEFLLSTQPTLGFKVVDTELSVASLSQWDGTPSNITPVGYASAEDSLSTENADQLVTFSRPDIPALDEDDFIASLHLETSQLAESGAPAPEADLLIYDGSEHGAERIQPGESFGEFRVQWDQDPRTSAPWTEAGVNEIEVGVASRTA